MHTARRLCIAAIALAASIAKRPTSHASSHTCSANANPMNPPRGLAL